MSLHGIYSFCVYYVRKGLPVLNLLIIGLWVQRIMGVKYSFPSNLHLSRECVDLISKIFIGNPSNRITITGIRNHPWFKKNLPEELCVSPEAAHSSPFFEGQSWIDTDKGRRKHGMYMVRGAVGSGSVGGK